MKTNSSLWRIFAARVPRRMGVAAIIAALAAAAWAQGAKPIQLGASCTTSECHANLKNNKFIHGPVNLNQCEPCHVPIGGQHQFKKTTDSKALCFTCHEAEKAKKVVHQPYKTDCASCHNPHGGDNRYFVKGGAGAQSCAKCHSDVKAGLNFVHGPVGQGECMACHTPHQSDNAHLLTDNENTLCLSCHTDFQEKLKGAVSIHKPAQQNCTGCHGAHGGKTQFFMTAEGRDLCKSCHGEFLKNVEKFKHPHKPLAEGKGCDNCHEPHASKQQRLLKEDNMELCLSCHNKTIQTAQGTLPNVQAQIKGSKFLHGPLRQNNCIACHAAHGSDFANILDKEFPASFYTPYADKKYDLCFECHDKKLVLAEKSADTGFRNGDVNLHYLHVHREKGRSCRACHDEHASNQPKHIREEVPFGRWMMHTQYTKTDTGGGCTTGCHLPYKYDRVNPVANKSGK